MATYSNQHWLLSHIRNSFISTDDTGMCETVMQSDDLPKHFLKKFQHGSTQRPRQAIANGHRKSIHSNNGNPNGKTQMSYDYPLQEVDFVCYPGLDISDDEDLDLSAHSFDIQMYPEVGAYRLRTNTAQKLEKMKLEKLKAARTKNVNVDDDVVPPERADFFVKKPIVTVSPVKKDSVEAKKDSEKPSDTAEQSETTVKSKLTLQLANSPKQSQNKFMEYARFDGTSQTGVQTKRIYVFLSMLPGRERNYPMKICVIASAKIIEVIGFICYRATIQYPEINLKPIRYYGLYMAEDNDDMDDFPPLDNREPCSKFGFSHLTLAERRPLVPVTKVDFLNNAALKPTGPGEEKSRNVTAVTINSLQGLDIKNTDSSNGQEEASSGNINDMASPGSNNEDEQQQALDYDALLSHDDMLEAPMYRTYRLMMVDKRFFKTEVTLGISGERIEIDQHKNAKFWSKQKAETFPIDDVAECDIIERRNAKATVRIYIKSSSSPSVLNSTPLYNAIDIRSSCLSANSSSSGNIGGSSSNAGSISPHSPTSPNHYAGSSASITTTSHASPFFPYSSNNQLQNQHHVHIRFKRFKHYDFEADLHTSEHIYYKLKCILEVRSGEARREFLHLRTRKLEKSLLSKKHFKV